LRLFFTIFSKSTFWTYMVYDLDDRMVSDGGFEQAVELAGKEIYGKTWK